MNKGKIFFVILFSLLVLPNLGTRPLWQDEAETALVARQMVKTNTWLPYAYDDQGPISQDWNYQFKISPLWRWHPWLQFYVTALSFKLIGVSAFSARLPFALLGIAAYWYFLNFLTRHGPTSSLRGTKRRGNPVFFIIAAVLFLLSVPLLLHLRQARYYSLSLFFTLLAIDGYLDLKRTVLGVRQGLSLKYIIGSILLFHSFLPAALALQISFWIDLIRTVLSRLKRSDLGQSQGRTLIQFSAAFSATLLFTLPWAIWLKIGGQNLNFSPDLIKQHLFQHYSYIHKFIFPVFVLIPLIFTRFSLNLLSKLANLRMRGRRAVRKVPDRTGVDSGSAPVELARTDDSSRPETTLFSIFISVSLLLYTFNHPYFFRYLVPLIPLFIYIAAWIIANTKPVWSFIPLISLILMTVKTFPKYLSEISHPYQTANAEIIGFLSSLDPEKYQKLAVNYDDFTFRFYTSFTVYGAQQLSAYKTEELERAEDGISEIIEEELSRTPSLISTEKRRRSERGFLAERIEEISSRLAIKQASCPDVIIIFPDWGNETLLREIATQCQLTPSPLSLHYAKLADDPDPINHRFTQPPLDTLEAFLAPPSPS